MTRADLTEEVYRAIGMPLKESDVVVRAIFDSIVRALRSRKEAMLKGLGCGLAGDLASQPGLETNRAPPIATGLSVVFLRSMATRWQSRSVCRSSRLRCGNSGGNQTAVRKHNRYGESSSPGGYPRRSPSRGSHSPGLFFRVVALFCFVVMANT
jgi:hypothetical protein